MTRVRVAVVGLLGIMASAAMAAPVRTGRVMCEGAGCASVDVPTGSLLERAGDFVSDFGERVKHRIEIAQKPPEQPIDGQRSTAVKNGRSRRRNVDRIRVSQARPIASQGAEAATNLPRYYAGIDHSGIEASEKVVYVPKSSDPKLKGLRPGDVVWAVVEQEIVASPSVPTPVRALAVSGQFKGGYFVGEATLDRELKRVLFSFTKFRPRGSEGIYALKATGLAPGGSIGLEGEYVSQTGRFFVAELASAAAAGFVDSTVNRSQTALGNYVQEPSVANSGKVAAATALSKTADRMAEQARNAPEYTKVPGYREIQIIIQDDPVELGS